MPSRRKINSSGREKLGEARFFLGLMEKSVENDAFVYFLSAFLSALCSVTEVCKLQPRGADDRDRYDGWKRRMDDGPLRDKDLVLLHEMRDGEVHRIPVEKLQARGMNFGPEAIGVSGGGSLQLDFSGGKVVRHEAGQAPVETYHPVTVSWHFDAPAQDNPDVLQTCRAGLAVVEQVIASRDAQMFDS
jgi:hypothetical protein